MLNNPASRPVSRVVVARSKDTPRTGTKNIRVYCRLAVAHILTSIKNGMTIRAERAASLAKCFVKNSVNIIIGKYE